VLSRQGLRGLRVALLGAALLLGGVTAIAAQQDATTDDGGDSVLLCYPTSDDHDNPQFELHKLTREEAWEFRRAPLASAEANADGICPDSWDDATFFDFSRVEPAAEATAPVDDGAGESTAVAATAEADDGRQADTGADERAADGGASTDDGTAVISLPDTGAGWAAAR